jgi:hypothetical protein
MFIEITEESPPCHLFDSFWSTDVLYISEMKCSTELGQDRIFSKEMVLSKIRTQNKKCEPYIRGTFLGVETTYADECCQLKRVDLVFNEDHSAWHYGWKSHRRMSERSHVLDVMVLVENESKDDEYFLAGSFPSPNFVITSTKSGRQRRSDDIVFDENFDSVP